MTLDHIHRHLESGSEFTITREGAIFLDGAQLVIPHQGKAFLTELYAVLDRLDSDSRGLGLDGLEEAVEYTFAEQDSLLSEEPDDLDEEPDDDTQELWHGFIIDFFPDFNYVRVWHQASPDEVYVFDPTETSDVSLTDDPYAALCRRAAKDYFDSHPEPKEPEVSPVITIAPGVTWTKNDDTLNWAGQNYVRQDHFHE